MDLLRIDARMVNLDRLNMIVEVEGEAPGRGRKVQLVLGDTTVTLNEEQSDRFLAFVRGNFRVREMDAPPVQWAPGERLDDAADAASRQANG